MVEQIDAGPIIDVARFPVPGDISVLGLEGMAYAHLAHLFWRMAKSLATDPKPPPVLAIEWAGPEIFPPRLSGDVRHSAGYSQG
jgi:methionyl-tRNA formyltransferase